MSKVVKHLGKDLLVKYLEHFVTLGNPNDTIVCFGDEDYLAAKLCHDVLKDKGDYSIIAASLDLLVHNYSSLIGRCKLFLAWPKPNKNYEDIRAINLLQPTAVLATLETTGGSGSDLFMTWFKELENYNDFMYFKDGYWGGSCDKNATSSLENIVAFKILESSYKEHLAPMGPFCYRYAIFLPDVNFPLNYERKFSINTGTTKDEEALKRLDEEYAKYGHSFRKFLEENVQINKSDEESSDDESDEESKH